MHPPPLRGRCERRVLCTWKLDPVVARRLVPAPLRPKLVGGAAVGAVDCMRLERLRPRVMPALLGLSMEMVTHLVVAQWQDGDRKRDVLFVLRRDVEVRGLGRAAHLLLPGRPHAARVRVQDEHSRMELACHSLDGKSELQWKADLAPEWQGSDLFSSRDQLLGLLGNRSGGFLAFDEMGRGSLVELDAQPERAETLVLSECHSSLFNGGSLPKGSAIPDAAVVLRELTCVWTSQGKVLHAKRKPQLELADPDGLQEPSPA